MTDYLQETVDALFSKVTQPKTAIAEHHVADAARAAIAEIRRLHAVHCPHYEGKVGEPNLSVADALEAALAKAEGK